VPTTWTVCGKSNICGKGVFARKDIEKDRVIFQVTGIRNSSRNLYTILIDGRETKMTGMARYINHSCDPNCIFQKATTGDGEEKEIVYFIPKRKILKGEELTVSYGQKYGLEICRCPVCCNK
jgi:SET domain-containing protein